MKIKMTQRNDLHSSFPSNKMMGTNSSDLAEEEKKEGDVSTRILLSVKQRVTFAPGTKNASTLQRPTKRRSLKKTKTPSSSFWWWIRFISHSILFLAFASFACVYVVRMIHDDYFVTLLEKARRTNDDLIHEYTYYERPCNVLDISANAVEARSELMFQETETSNQAVDKMMMHGALMIPHLLTDAMVSELRDFVVWKNNVTKGTSAEYPVTEADFRISYGIDATEHPTVIRALNAIHSSKRLSSLLEGLVGKNPALTEITAITSQAGSKHQPWHPDVKPDGNGIQFGRTYAHSYSLFIPLQNVTARMGATDLCPGTHYCTNWIDAQCNTRKIGLHQFRKEDVWKAGDAVLLNQQVWHRGTQHTDPMADDRILFIVSFIGRPTDNRQLARGTYFHMKWNMWGHTWNDLARAATSMAYPWNVLRCLHIWKPSDKEWGWDLFTSATLRIANGQLGCEPEDLEIFLNKLDSWGFPPWLDGTINLGHPEAWQLYFRETIPNIFSFLLKANCALVLGYAVILTLCEICSRQTNFTIYWKGLLQLCKTAGLVFVVTVLAINKIQSSTWARDITSGKTLARPFPFSESQNKQTTLPQRYDVLIGSRLASKSIAAYHKWHDYHPGNRQFLDYVENYANLFQSYRQGLPSTFSQELIQRAIKLVESHPRGRFLHQEYQSGDWILLSQKESNDYTANQLGRTARQHEFQEEIDYLLDQERFGWQYRGTALSRISQKYLQDCWEKELLADNPSLETNENGAFKPSIRRPQKSLTEVLSTPPCYVPKTTPTSTYWTTFLSEQDESEVLRPLSEVLYKFFQKGNINYIPATIVTVSSSAEEAEIALYGVTAYGFNYNPTVWVSVQDLVPNPFLVAYQTRVSADYLSLGELFSGQIQRVRPNARIDVLYEDGDFEEAVWPAYYHIIKSSSSSGDEETIYYSNPDAVIIEESEDEELEEEESEYPSIEKESEDE